MKTITGDFIIHYKETNENLKQKLNNTFINWKGNLEHVDVVTKIAIRV